jgi:hypothetical protein
MHLDSDGHFASRSVKLLPAVEAELRQALATAGSKGGSCRAPWSAVYACGCQRRGRPVKTLARLRCRLISVSRGQQSISDARCPKYQQSWWKPSPAAPNHQLQRQRSRLSHPCIRSSRRCRKQYHHQQSPLVRQRTVRPAAPMIRHRHLSRMVRCIRTLHSNAALLRPNSRFERTIFDSRSRAKQSTIPTARLHQQAQYHSRRLRAAVRIPAQPTGVVVASVLRRWTLARKKWTTWILIHRRIYRRCPDGWTLTQWLRKQQQRQLSMPSQRRRLHRRCLRRSRDPSAVHLRNGPSMSRRRQHHHRQPYLLTYLLT